MSSDSEWGEWIGEGEKAKCLFCDVECEEVLKCLEHCKSNHGFDYISVKRERQLDIYDHIKLVNFVRSQVKDNPSLCHTKEYKLPADDQTWKHEKYLKPVLESDPILYYEFDEPWESASPKEGITQTPADIPEKSTLDSLIELKKAIDKKSLEAEEKLTLAKKILNDEKNQGKGKLKNSEGSDSSEEDEDEGYFESYGAPYIHDLMLKDRTRTESYRDFIYKNSHLIKDKLVLDVGCGTGILSMFASQAGAKWVVGVDKSSIIYKARGIISENKFENISLIHGKIESFETLRDVSNKANLVDKVDVIISEWMGYCLLYESMLPSVIIARDRWLKPDGSVYPDLARINICAMQNGELRKEKIDFWSDIYGFKMNPMKEAVISDCLVHSITPESVISTRPMLKEFNINTVQLDEMDFKSNFKLTIQKDGFMDAFVVFFDVEFTKGCTSPIKLETGPFAIRTHWEQALFWLEKRLEVVKGDTITATFACSHNRDYHRELDIFIKFQIEGKSELFEQRFFVR